MNLCFSGLISRYPITTSRLKYCTDFLEYDSVILIPTNSEGFCPRMHGYGYEYNIEYDTGTCT